ncbi:ATP-binding protein [Streptomyces sp. NPDC091371]|uniref:ATP-binding protein n=1 Tax=Streptomyces sp. NPDC091371 TaxID=3155303 RepID=UPI00343AD147
MSLPLTRRIARAALLVAAGTAPVVGAAGAASAAGLEPVQQLGALTAPDTADAAATAADTASAAADTAGQAVPGADAVAKPGGLLGGLPVPGAQELGSLPGGLPGGLPAGLPGGLPTGLPLG